MESLSICPYHEINGQIDKLNDYLTNKGKETRAAAQTGQVPQPEFEKLLEEYTGENYDYNVPEISEPFSAPQIKYWKRKFFIIRVYQCV